MGSFLYVFFAAGFGFINVEWLSILAPVSHCVCGLFSDI